MDLDAKDIQLINDGKQIGYENILNRYKDYVFNLVVKVVGNPAEAQEVAQDVFVKAFNSLSSFRGTSKFSTWLYRIAYTTSISHIRKEKKHRGKLDLEEPAAMSLEDGGKSDFNLIEEEKSSYIKLAVEFLNDTERAIIEMYYFKEMSLKEIGQVIKQPDNNVKIRLFRARKKLSVHLKRLLKNEVGDLL